MKDDPQRVAAAGAQAAYAVPEIDAIGTPRTLDWTVADGKDHAVAAPEGDDFRTRLHARPLLGEDEFAASEIGAGLFQQDRDLKREDVFAVHVLVQAVEIARDVLKEERGGPTLAGFVATLDKRAVLFRVTDIDAHRFVPAVRDLCERRI
jgi:hypothetical protein